MSKHSSFSMQAFQISREIAEKVEPKIPAASQDEVRRVLSAKNDYEVLQLRPGVARMLVKKKYRSMTMALHPDKCKVTLSSDLSCLVLSLIFPSFLFLFSLFFFIPYPIPFFQSLQPLLRKVKKFNFRSPTWLRKRLFALFSSLLLSFVRPLQNRSSPSGFPLGILISHHGTLHFPAIPLTYSVVPLLPLS